MTVLTLRTDRPEAELGLYDNQKQLSYIKWQAHLELSKTIHTKIQEFLSPQPLQGYTLQQGVTLHDVQGIVCYSGPGSFTGLRIGLSVANALAYAQDIPIVAKTGQGWIKAGIKDLLAGRNDKIALPKYGSPPNVTKPRK